jgi:O-antigen/teichoic acid export membrane protein
MQQHLVTDGPHTRPHRLKYSFRLVRVNALWNIAGYSVPALVALIAIPLILANLGSEKLGILTLVWTLIGFFGLFDLGLGRSITHFAAQAHSQEDRGNFTAVVTVGTLALLTVGIIVGGVSLLAVFYLYGQEITRLSDHLDSNIAGLTGLIALGAPIALVSVALRSGLEATQDFRSVNLVRIPTGALTFASPAVISIFTQDVFYAVGSVVIARLVATVGFSLFLRRWLAKSRTWDIATLLRLAKYGGWASVSGLVSPLLVHIDRFVVAAYLSLEALAMYGSVFDVLIRLLVIPAAISGALFPALSSLRTGSNERIKEAFFQCTSAILLSLGAVATVLAIFAYPLISFWLGREFAEATSVAAAILLVGVVINGYAHVPYTCLQGIGRPDIPARFHILELLIYVPLLIVLVQRFGIIGAAYAWLIRVLIDAVLLTAAVRQKLKMERAP